MKKIWQLLKKEYFRLLIVIFSSLLYSVALMWFLDPINIYAGGMAGLGQLITKIFTIKMGIPMNLGLVVLILNIPLFLVAVRYISVRFAIYSGISIALQSFFVSGIIPVLEFFQGEPPYLLFAIIGGCATGVAAAVALRFGTSTGGMDMVGQALAFKKNISIGYMTMIFNFIIALVAGIIFNEPNIFFYTLVRIIITSITTDKIHTAYNFVRLEIITTSGGQISQELLSVLGHGVTITKGVGAYTHTEKDILTTVIFSYEIITAKEIVGKYDPNSFVSVLPVKKILGRFRRKTIA